MKNLIQTALVTLFAASTAQAQQAVQWKVSDGGNGHWYSQTAFGTFNSWTAATEYATSSGAHLATIVNQMEQEFVVSVLKVSTCEAWGGLIWLGAQQMPGLPADQGWSWSTNETWKFTNWSQGEPNDFDGWAEDRLCMYAATGRWNDGTDIVSTYSCNFAAMLEWSADCNNDGIVDYGQCHDGTLPDYNSNNIPDCCERSETCVVGHYPVQWRSEDGGNGHWYKRNSIPDGGSFDSIRQLATASGGDLASIHSAAQDRFVQSIAMPYSWNNGALIGTRTPPGCTNFAWSDGTPWDFTNWGSGQPNCKVGDGVGYYEDGWHDLYDFDVASFITEWSADCNNDNIVDYGQILQGQLVDANTNGIPDICEQPTCRDADLFRDLNVNGADLGILLSQWGPNAQFTVSDINKDGFVNGADLGLLLSFWGACP